MGSNKVNALQRCINLIEALVDAQSEIKNFRTHCNDIITCAQVLHPVMIKAEKEFPDVTEANGASVMFHKLNDVLEEALLVIRKSSTLSQMEKLRDKFLEHGESKQKLDDILTSVQAAVREMDAFLTGFQNSRKAGPSSSNPTPVVAEGSQDPQFM